jgi:hypothetical protein
MILLGFWVCLYLKTLTTDYKLLTNLLTSNLQNSFQ